MPAHSARRRRGCPSVVLDERVPLEVRRLFEAAKRTLLYGPFFCPLFALGEEQLYRVADTAVLMKYRSLNGPRRGRHGSSLESRIQWLRKKGALTTEQAERWDALRELRNSSSSKSVKMAVCAREA